MVLVWDSGILCESAVMAFNRYTISRSYLHSLWEVVHGCKAMQVRICKSSHKSKTSNCNTLSTRARVGTCISVSTGKSCEKTLKRKRFHRILHKIVAPNIGQKLSSNQWPIILDAEPCATICPGERMLVAITSNVTFLHLRPYCEEICTSFLNDAEI